jgi:phosphopantetheinyl transferase
MALFFQHTLSRDAKLAVWKIEEPETFFRISSEQQRLPSHPYKRLQHLAGRYLLTLLFPEFNLLQIQIDEHGKPFLPDHSFQFSISHSGNYAAAIVSRFHPVGIDVELETPRIKNIVSRFLSEKDQMFLNQHAHLPALQLQLQTMFWSAKESMFKWYGRGMVDFKEQMQLNGPVVFHSDEQLDLVFHFSKEVNRNLKIHGRAFSPLVLTWLLEEHNFIY